MFVRGLPLDTLQYELQDRMSRFGKLKACRCSLPQTDRPLLQRQNCNISTTVWTDCNLCKRSPEPLFLSGSRGVFQGWNRSVLLC